MAEFAQRQHSGVAPVLLAPIQPEREAPHPVGTLDSLLTAQQALGNQAVQRLLRTGALQAKLNVRPHDDRFEQEADAVAEQVMRMPAVEKKATVPRADSSPGFRQERSVTEQISPLVQRQTEEEEEEEPVQTKSLGGPSPPFLQLQPEEEEDEEVQTKSLDTSSAASIQLQSEEEEEKEELQTKRGAAVPVSPGPTLESQLQAAQTGGKAMSPDSSAFFESRFGRDFSSVRVHDGPQAANLSRALNAQAFTRGSHIFFGAGRYQPSSDAGRRLLSHELTHTVQQGAAGSALSAPGPNNVPTPNPVQRKVNWAAPRRQSNPLPIGMLGSTASSAIARQAAPPAETAAGAGEEPSAPSPGPLEPVSLTSPTFQPSTAVADAITAAGRAGARVPVKLGRLAQGRIPVREEGEGYGTVEGKDGYHPIPFTHPATEPLRSVGVNPVLAVRILDGSIDGYATVGGENGTIFEHNALLKTIEEHPEQMGWLGLDQLNLPEPENKLEGGVFRLQVSGFNFRLGGFLDGTGDFGLANEAVTFNGTASVHIAGVTDSELQISRDEEGNLRGRAEVPVAIANFSGNLIADYLNGNVDIEGSVGYATDKLSGTITLLVTDAATARNIAVERLGPEAVVAAGEESAGRTEEGPAPGERALAGYGVLDFALTEWLTGQAQVIVNNEGYVTIVGKIAPPAEVELFPQRDYIKGIFKVEVRTLYGVPLVGNIFVFANIGLEALAKLGPGKIYNIVIDGRFSTDPNVLQEFSLAGTLNISAFAGLRLRGEGGAGVELVGHDIKAGVGVNALAGVRGYVEATPTIGYREVAAPAEGKQGEFFLNGHMELAAQPFLGLGGDLFVELDSPWWSPAPDKKWTWPLGQLEYPLPGEFGIGADVDYVIGSPELPEIQFTEVDFSADKFMTDLMSDHVPPKSKGEQDKSGEWKEGTGGGEATPGPPAHVDTAGAPPAGKPASSPRTAAEGEPPKPEVAQKWQAGMQELGKLTHRSESDPFTEQELEPELNRIKRQHGFRALSPKREGDNWRITAGMSPGGNVTVKAEDEDKRDDELPETRITHQWDGKKAGSVEASPLTWKGPKGTRPKSEKDFPFQWRRVRSFDPDSRFWVRMHLLSEKLHGTGREAWNITPGDKKANSAMERQFERDAKKRVGVAERNKKKEALWYHVSVVYRTGTDEDFPRGISIAYGNWDTEQGRPGTMIKSGSVLVQEPPAVGEQLY